MPVKFEAKVKVGRVFGTLKQVKNSPVDQIFEQLLHNKQARARLSTRNHAAPESLHYQLQQNQLEVRPRKACRNATATRRRCTASLITISD
jgi:hypothetical protein